jgi:hypothetical protein
MLTGDKVTTQLLVGKSLKGTCFEIGRNARHRNSDFIEIRKTVSWPKSTEPRRRKA